ncbi:MAG: DUF692 family multinuclear iron-containing protein [Myxococcota bacterium]
MIEPAPSREPALGLSLRERWLREAHDWNLDAVEIIADAWFFAEEEVLVELERLRTRAPFFLHCLGMNVGSHDGLDPEYVDRVRTLADRFEVSAVSDHLAWRSVDGAWSTTFLPLRWDETSLRHVAERIHGIQEPLGRTLALETPAQYFRVKGSELSSAEALLALHELCGSRALIDVCNLRISAHHTGESLCDALDTLPMIGSYVHVAGFRQGQERWLDDHGSRPDVRTMAWAASTDLPVILEWDRNMPDGPELSRLLVELRRALARRTTAGEDPGPAQVTALEDSGEALIDWQRSFMDQLMEGREPSLQALFSEQVYSALLLLEATFPVSTRLLGSNFRWFVREFVRQCAPSDVHARSWPAAFVRFLDGREELDTPTKLYLMQEEWWRHAG